MRQKQYLGSRALAASACALCVVVSACSDDGANGDPSTSEQRPDAASDARVTGDASSDVTASDADAAAEDAGTDATADVATDVANDGGDAEPDAGDAADDAAPRCALLDCDDDIDCTVDACDETRGCTHTASNTVCDDANRCTFDYCAVAAGGCAHRDVSSSVELLVNGHFDYGANVAWRLDPLNLSPSQIHKNAQLAHTGAWYVWLGALSNFHMRLWQDVEVPATASELTLSGVYEVTPGQGAPSLSSYCRIEIENTLTGEAYQRALSLGSTQTNEQWVPFSFTMDEPHAGKVLKVEISSYNGLDDLAHFKVDTLSLRAKICPAE